MSPSARAAERRADAGLPAVGNVAQPFALVAVRRALATERLARLAGAGRSASVGGRAVQAVLAVDLAVAGTSVPGGPVGAAGAEEAGHRRSARRIVRAGRSRGALGLAGRRDAVRTGRAGRVAAEAPFDVKRGARVGGLLASGADAARGRARSVGRAGPPDARQPVLALEVDRARLTLALEAADDALAGARPEDRRRGLVRVDHSQQLPCWTRCWKAASQAAAAVVSNVTRPLAIALERAFSQSVVTAA